MKIYITWRATEQIGPDDWQVTTKVLECKKTDTFGDIHEVLTKEWKGKSFDGEIHFVPDEVVK